MDHILGRHNSLSPLPGYRSSSLACTPPYSAEPHAQEQRIALNRLRRRPSGDFVKHSRSGGLSLWLSRQDSSANLPAYGCGDFVEGTVTLSKPETTTSVEVRIEGSLRLKEVAEGGTTATKLCASTVTLWGRDAQPGQCPPSLPFSLALPPSFTDGRDTYPLPPTHEAQLSGVPGFHAVIEYIITAVAQKGRSSGLLRSSNSTVSTPFVYYPRSRPAVPLPPPILRSPGPHGMLSAADWRRYETVMTAKVAGVKDITARFYIPTARVFSMAEPIPFHLIFASTPSSLAAFLPFGPTGARTGARQHTRVQLLRQTNVDARGQLVLGTKTDIWRTVEIGDAAFRHAGDGPDWTSYSGEICVSDQIRIGGFKAGGLTIRDFIVLSMTPPDPSRAPFHELRQVVPVRLTTDSWESDGAGQTFSASDYTIPLITSDPRLLDAPIPYGL
ncbi:uncharacterized protein LAESUDRAFT_670568 [Laetiporus sulphureus 93-53]|uniref:Arrestin-like N-terminal domain-containing protein n=1 Tax=Laetiporus sulphureus 93-53 TaxID=1314785 RepID=A0A165HUQ6_9APHY|nr:uncharacterized protein LAESUDRAFT_670568 [Laetiporus sulphureus 93-53]KZT12213.1 hypothetical protein LAESUDRAFT_670568 [Laetiporus sulphureus 93-53]